MEISEELIYELHCEILCGTYCDDLLLKVYEGFWQNNMFRPYNIITIFAVKTFDNEIFHVMDQTPNLAEQWHQFEQSYDKKIAIYRNEEYLIERRGSSYFKLTKTTTDEK